MLMLMRTRSSTHRHFCLRSVLVPAVLSPRGVRCQRGYAEATLGPPSTLELTSTREAGAHILHGAARFLSKASWSRPKVFEPVHASLEL